MKIRKQKKSILLCPVCASRYRQAKFCPKDGALLTLVKGRKTASAEANEISILNKPAILGLPVGTRAGECPLCKLVFAPGLLFCPADATKLIEAVRPLPYDYEKKCPQCKRTVDPSLTVCPLDGTLLMIAKKDIHLAQQDFGRYEVLKVLAKSTKSTVYEARETTSKKRFVIKLLEVKPSDQSFTHAAERFLRQLDSHKKLSHTNIVQVIEQGRTSNGLVYLVFEFVPGAFSLEGMQGGLANRPADYFLEILDQICEALEYAHGEGIYHHDLSPADILIEESADDMIKVKITDFAKGAPLIHGDNRSQQFTEQGDLFGHPQFMSPESCRGATVDAVSNVYSLGCVMYWLLSREKPFEGAHWVAVLLNKIDGVANPLVVKSDDQAFKLLEPVVNKCMENDRKKRYGSIAELRAALQTIPRTSENIVSHQKLKQLLAESVPTC